MFLFFPNNYSHRNFFWAVCICNVRVLREGRNLNDLFDKNFASRDVKKWKIFFYCHLLKGKFSLSLSLSHSPSLSIFLTLSLPLSLPLSLTHIHGLTPQSLSLVYQIWASYEKKSILIVCKYILNRVNSINK